MRNQRVFKLLILFPVVIAVILTSGCTTTIKVHTRPEYQEFFTEESATEGRKHFDAYLEPGTVSFNGIPGNVNPAFQARVYQLTRDLDIFKDVFNQKPPTAPGKLVRVDFFVDENSVYNRVLSGFKGFLIGASLYTLSPLIPFYAEFKSVHKVRFVKPDGSSKDYSASTDGKAKFYFNGISTFYQELSGRVAEENFKSLRSQIRKDSKLVP